MGVLVQLSSRRHVRRLKKPAILPIQPALDGFDANPIKLVPARLELTSFPLRDSPLRDTRDLGQLSLGKLEDGLPDMKHRGHAVSLCENELIRQGISCENNSRLPLTSVEEGSMEVAQVLTTIMTVKGWKQAKLAREIDVSQGQISKWVNGNHYPNKRQWDAVLDILEGDPRLKHLLDALRAPAIPGIDPGFYTALRRLSPRRRQEVVNFVKGLAEDEVA